MKKSFIRIVGLILAGIMILGTIGCNQQGVSSSTTSEENVEKIELTGTQGLRVTIKNTPKLYYTKEMKPDFSSAGDLSLWTETSPCLYTVNGITRCVITNSKSASFDMLPGKSLLDDDFFDTASGKLSVWPNNVNPETKTVTRTSKLDRAKLDIWKPVYYGLYSVWSDDKTTYSIIHGENKNSYGTENGVEYFFNNTVKPDNTEYTPEQYSGYDGRGDDWENYFAFVCSAANDNDDVEKTGNLIANDYGPIIWPDNGYLDATTNENISTGPRHPCALVYEEYIYVFYLIEMGHGGTIRVARAPVSGGAKPGTFKKYYAETAAFDQDALPENFDKDDREMVYKMSGMSTPVIESGNPIQFSVAHVKNTDYFVGILEETDSGGHFTSICVSKDLINWTQPLEIPGTRCTDWNNGYLHYPKIYSKDFSTSMEVDTSGFFVTGTSSNYGGWMLPQYMPLTIEITENN